jgi:hypothetical protein
MTVRIAEHVPDLDAYGTLLCVFHRREILRLAAGNNIERRLILPIFKSDVRIQSVMLRDRGTLPTAVWTLVRIGGRWFAVSAQK